MRPRSFIGAGCALLLLAPALAHTQSNPAFVLVDDAFQANNQPGATSLTVPQGAKVGFSYPAGRDGNGHNVIFKNRPRPSCPGVPKDNEYGVRGWEGECTFTEPGTYQLVCQWHESMGMKGSVTVQAPSATPVLTASPTATPGGGGGDPSPGATPTPTPATSGSSPTQQTTIAVRLLSGQRGTRVRGRVEVQRAGSRLEVSLMRGRVRAGRSVRTVVAGTVTFSVPLNAGARRALRTRGRLSVRVVVALTPPSGTKITRSERVTLRR